MPEIRVPPPLPQPDCILPPYSSCRPRYFQASYCAANCRRETAFRTIFIKKRYCPSPQSGQIVRPPDYRRRYHDNPCTGNIVKHFRKPQSRFRPNRYLYKIPLPLQIRRRSDYQFSPTRFESPYACLGLRFFRHNQPCLPNCY